MAKRKHNLDRKVDILNTNLLEKIYVHTHFDKNNFPGKDGEDNFFISKNLKKYGEELESIKNEYSEYYSKEWQNFQLSVQISEKEIFIRTLPQELTKFEENLKLLEYYYLYKSLMYIEQVLEEFIKSGQELLRRKYLAVLLSEGKKIVTTEVFELIIETGAEAIQKLGRAPAPPILPFKKFNNKQRPFTSTTGIEILSSGAFRDWNDDILSELKAEKKVDKAGFENVLEAALDTPRTKVLLKAYKEGKNISAFLFPGYLRMMLDLELMRLGQATTPGTYTMLLNSYYYGALIVDQSTNVSEQVQIIYDEENWKSANNTSLEDKNPTEQAQNIAADLLLNFFRTKNDSPIDRDHPRTARIEFSEEIKPDTITKFFTELLNKLESGIKTEKTILRINPEVHNILPVLSLKNFNNRVKTVKDYLDAIKKTKINELALMADFTKHHPGLLQYFNDYTETNEIINYASQLKIILKDGKSVDMVATSNKAIEAAAGALASGMGCIKIGLLGLTYEQMSDFIHKVKTGIQSRYKRQKNQLLIFIGLIDEPIVTDKKVYTNAYEISKLFIDLMRRKKHDILLLDTMHKGIKDKRYVSEKDINPKDEKGGHLTFSQSKELISLAHKAKCDLWVAGSYTEEQVYQASLEPPEYRPGLICLGGAERSFGGIRLDPRDAYEAETKEKDEHKLSALVELDSDIKFLLSRENKLARDSGLVEGELRRKKRKEADELKEMRNKYLKIRNEYFNNISKSADSLKIQRKNIDYLIFNQEKLFSKSGNFTELKKQKELYFSSRKEYVNKVSDYLYELFKDDWFD